MCKINESYHKVDGIKKKIYLDGYEDRRSI